MTTLTDKITTIFNFLTFRLRPYLTVPIRGLIRYFLLKIKNTKPNAIIIGPNNTFKGAGKKSWRAILGPKLASKIPKYKSKILSSKVVVHAFFSSLSSSISLLMILSPYILKM